MNIKLLKGFDTMPGVTSKKGDVLDVSEADAKRLVEEGIAEYEKTPPPTEKPKK